MALSPRVMRLGTTSACAENTYFGTVVAEMDLELPPRARRIHTLNYTPPQPHGTTSACAENTAQKHVWGYRPGNYLRVRGEYCYDDA